MKKQITIYTVTVMHTGVGKVVKVSNYSSQRKATESYKTAQGNFPESQGYVVQLFSEALEKEAYSLGAILK
jgi:hypothetical protein